MLWLTRSEPGASRQADELRAEGHRVLVAPVLQIEATAAPVPSGSADIVIFLSEHAVSHAAAFDFAAAAEIFAVGARTRQALADIGLAARTPDLESSEGLLELPELAAVAGKRVILVAGEGGRSLLAETLRARGARVDEYRCYRRRAVTNLPVPVAGIRVIVAASGDGLRALAAIWQAAQGDFDVPLLVPSSRVAEIARELRFTRVIVCGGADTRAILSGLKQIATS